MKSQPIFLAICFLLLFGFTVNSQSSFQEDSLRIEALTKGMDTYFKNPLLYKKNTFEAYPLIQKMLNEQPNNLYLKKKRNQIYDLYFTFRRNELAYQESLDILLKTIKYKKELKDSCGLSKSYRNLGGFWRIQKDYEKSLPYSEKALQIARNNQCRKDEVRSLMHIASHYFALKDLEKALENNFKALKTATQYKDAGGVGNAHYQLARNYSLKKNFDKSFYHISIAEKIFKETENISALERVTSAKAIYYRKTGKPEKAIDYYQKAVDYNLRLKDSSRLMSRYLGLSNSYRDLKDFRNAYYSYLNYKGLQKRLNDKKYYGELIKLETRLTYENQKKVDSIRFAQQKLLDESEIKRKANTRFWLFAILLSVIVLTVLVFYWNSRHKLKEQAYQNILLNKKVASKTEEIQELLKETMRHIKSKEKIATDLQRFSKEKDGTTLQSILADLKASKADDTKLILIKENIEKINFDFLKALKEKHPNLSKTEIEVCSFIKMGLSRKEIAEVRGTSDYAVKTMRNRIRKKIKIDSSITLDNYLSSF